MAESWYPNPGVTQVQHERLMGASGASGVFGHPADQSVVYAPGSGTREVRVRAGRRAVVEGYGWENENAELVLPSLAANSSGSARVDLVVLRLDRSDWSVRVKVAQGAPGAGVPSPSTSTGTSGTYELPLAEVIVDSGATTIASSKVKNRAWYISSDGQIRCTKDTYPSHEAGRAVWLYPEGRWQVSTGDRWLVAAEDSQGAIAPFGGFSHSSAVLRRRSGMVTFALTAWRPTAMSANTEYRCANVPDGFRPVAHMSTVGIVPSTGSVFTCSVGTDGAVLLNPGATSIPGNRACVLGAMSYPVA